MMNKTEPAVVTNRRRRLAQLIDEQYESQSDFVAKSGQSQSEVSGLLKSKSFGEKKARSIEEKCNLPMGWLDVAPADDGTTLLRADSMPFIGKGTPVTVGNADADDVIRIKKVTLTLEAGFPAFEADQDFEDGGYVNVPRKWVDDNDLVPQCLISIKVRGASMEPMLFDGDSVVVNVADVKPVSGAIYAINFNGHAMVKQMVKIGPDWWLHSFNPDKQYARVMCRGGECIVIGKIVHQGARSLIGKL